jgi:FSR family fosmidomycin resistance protein-like MFS transporter
MAELLPGAGVPLDEPSVAFGLAQGAGPGTRADRLTLLTLSAGHLIVDINPGALTFLAVFLKPAFHLSYAAVFLLLTVSQVTGSVMQPLFGWLTDRLEQRWLLPLGCATAGVGTALIAVGPDYLWLLAMVALSGLGVAAFHPEAARGASLAAGGRPVSGMAAYSVGGNVGYALGPPVVALLWRLGGIHSLWALALPTTAMAVVLLALRGRMVVPRAHGAPPPLPMRVVFSHPPLLRLLGMVTLRSWVQMGFAAFLPFVLIASHGVPRAETSGYVFVFLMAGAVGTALGGPAADRWGRRRVVELGMAVLTPLALLALVLPPAYLPFELAIMGAALVSSFAITTVMAQAMLPHNTGMASALLIGFAIGMGGVGVWLLGIVADHIGPLGTLVLVAFLPLPALWLAHSLPDDRRGDVGVATA